MTEIIVRPLLASDMPAIGQVAPGAYAVRYAGLWASAADLATQLTTFGSAYFTELSDVPDAEIWVATMDKAIIGFLSLRLNTAPLAPILIPESAEIHRLYLLPQAHGIGIGSAMLRCAARSAARHGAKRVWLSAFAHMEGLLNIYARWGFVRIGSMRYPKPVRTEFQELAIMAQNLPLHAHSYKRVNVQLEQNADLGELRNFYLRQSYHGEISAEAMLVSARADGRVVGLVRVEPENGDWVLRGMNVDLAWQGMGIGQKMLTFLKPMLPPNCYCLPHSWLGPLYGSIGFRRLLDAGAPVHLAQRLRNYYQQGEHPILMVR